MKKISENRFGKILAASMTFIIAISLLCGCGNSLQSNSAGDGTNRNNGASGEDGTASDGQPSDKTAMGRYLEKVSDLRGSLGGYREQLCALGDGTLKIAQPMANIYSSKDNGDTWTEEPYDWLEELLQNGGFLEDCAFGTDGTIGIVYSGTGMGEAAETNNDSFSEESAEAWYASRRTNVLIIRPDGTQMPVTLPVEKEDSPRHIWISDTGRIFAGTYDSPNLYEIGEDGFGKVFLTLEDSPQLIQFVENRMIIDGYDYGDLVIYDMETGSYIEDTVLNAFVKENYGDRSFNGGSWYDLFFFSGADDILYLAGNHGVHRHVIGGSAMEQIVDADLSTFGNPSYKLLGMQALDNNEFIALFTDARLVRYTYDATVPTVPNEKIKAYSLENNNMLRRAISIYQTEHPEAYVEYEIGMEEGSALTKEDALKKLNTQIMAGEGPDLLILDGMPTDSYIEKGLLKDIAPLLEELSKDEELFDNITGAFRKEGKIYMAPCEAGLPTIAGPKEYVSQMTDLSGIADGMEALREDYPGSDLLMLCSEKTIMMNFVTACAPAWVTKDGAIDQEAVEEYLIQMKRIYDAQMNGLSDEAIQRFAEWEKDSMTYQNEHLDDIEYYRYGMDEFNYIVGDRQFLAGLVSYAYAYAELTSVQRINKFEEDIILPMNGQSSDVFCASTVAGINALSENTPHAEGLLKVLLGDEDITSLGFPVNRKAFEASLYPDDYESPDDVYSQFGYLQDDGTAYTWNIYWFFEQQADDLRRRMETVDTPYIGNTALQEAVLNAGAAYLRGEMSLDEAVSDVQKRMAIYLAE